MLISVSDRNTVGRLPLFSHKRKKESRLLELGGGGREVGEESASRRVSPGAPNLSTRKC